ncbi:protein NUCLEAR FUSION DEFECTIVE 4-like [Punica granatum]|uniref:Protein NUCLEAR FUSION DEFECTIVE 4-like n=1 Tax=Punica granatum TaxID=22663 RepID=A0A6P8E510_PUNGR|nr:protein NUCLEAR FUSION DEFECTIVE 4-like [Punica granatum]
MPPRAISRRVARVGVYQWLSLVAAIWLQSISGTNFNFPAYSSHLKQAMSICQVDLNNLAFASDAGKLLGWLSGVAALHLPIWLVLLIGASLGLISYGLQYLFLANHIPTAELSYPLLFFLTMLAGNSICWMNTVCYAVIIGSFPSGSRQVAVGLTTAYQGLSANIYTNIVNVVAPAPTFAVSPHTPHPTAGRRANTYLLLSSVLPAIVSAVTAPFVSEKDDIASHGVRELFGVLYVITIATGLYAVISSMGAIATKISPVYNAIGIGLFLIAPLMIPLIKRIRGSWLGRWWTNRQHESTRITDVAMSGSEAEDSHHLGGGESVLVIIKGGGHGDRQGNIGTVREDVGVKLMLRRLDFWLYFFMYLCGATLGLVYLNNLGQITESRGTSRTSTLVSLSSAFSFFGRLLPSLLDYFSREKYMISRPACVVALMVPMTGSFFLLLNSSILCHYISTAVISACTGAITSIAVSITTELFGTKNFSVNHNILVANIPIGSFIFGYFAAVLYRREGNGDGECIGMECYRNSFIIWGCLCFLGTNLALLLYARSRSFYSQGSTRR